MYTYGGAPVCAFVEHRSGLGTRRRVRRGSMAGSNQAATSAGFNAAGSGIDSLETATWQRRTSRDWVPARRTFAESTARRKVPARRLAANPATPYRAGREQYTSAPWISEVVGNRL